jgi:GNAT superfamily N-acetyltransferase
MFSDSESESIYADERGVEWDYDSFSEDEPIGAAEAVVHPDARNDGDFMLNMDDSDEPLTVLGEYLGEPRDPRRIDDESYRYTGAPARRLFSTASRPDALIVGAFELKPEFQGRDYPNALVDALLRSIGRRAGFVAVEPDKKARGENGVDYWRGHGFRRFNKTHVFVRKVLPVKARAYDGWEDYDFGLND